MMPVSTPEKPTVGPHWPLQCSGPVWIHDDADWDVERGGHDGCCSSEHVPAATSRWLATAGCCYWWWGWWDETVGCPFVVQVALYRARRAGCEEDGVSESMKDGAKKQKTMSE